MDQLLGVMPGRTSAADRYLPEPAVTGTGVFQDLVEIAKGALSAPMSTALGLSETLRELGLNESIGGVPLNATGDFGELISLQIQAQQEMQVTSLVSNIERSKHESKMSAVRNIRVG